MTISADQGSQVIVQEINLSQVIVAASTSVVAQVIVSNQGPTVPTLITNPQVYLTQYGNPDPTISFDVYCGLDYFKAGSNLWGLRVVDPTTAMYAAVLMWTDGTETYLTQIAAGVNMPTEPDWAMLLPEGSGNEAIALFYPALGPGQYGDNTAIAITSNNLTTPTGLALTSAITGGMLTPNTYSYQVSAVSTAGETLATSVVTIVIAAGTDTNTVTLTWNPVLGATGYNVYGRVAGTIGLLTTVGGATTTFTDTGAVTPSAQMPITSPADLPPANPFFTVTVYNTAVSSTYPVESWTCSLTNNTSPSGMQTELEQAINPFSQYIQVTSNVPSLMTVPTVESVAVMNMAGGAAGNLPTTYEVAGAWSTFSNKQLYPINILMNSGHSDPTTQLAMDTLAQGRGDSVSLLDVPSASQTTAQEAMDYRNLQLNLNSTYSGLFSPDMLEADTINGMQVYVPFSGWAAALCARTDAVANPSFSIAGLNRGIVNVLGTRATYDQGDMNSLFQSQVNYTQTFVGAGTALWEQQTLSTEFSALSWISVRRITNVLKTALYNFLLYSLQEPNDPFLGNQIVGSCSAYLLTLQNARAISSFDVVSDTSNNTTQDFNSGIRNVTVIIVPIIPTHIINLQVVVSQQGVSFAETLSQVQPG
jgi:hypothetical protein